MKCKFGFRVFATIAQLNDHIKLTHDYKELKSLALNELIKFYASETSSYSSKMVPVICKICKRQTMNLEDHMRIYHPRSKYTIDSSDDSIDIDSDEDLIPLIRNEYKQ